MTTKVGLRGHRVQNEQRAAARRRDILVAAARVFARKGYEATTIDDVAAQLGFSKGVIYYYFRGKEDIDTAIRMTSLRESVARIEAIVERGQPPDETLRAIFDDLIRNVLLDLDRHTMLSRRAPFQTSDPEARSQAMELQRRYRALVVGVLRQGVEHGVFAARDPRVSALFLLRASLSVAEWYRPNGRTSSDEIIDQVVEMVMASVLTSDSPPP